MQRALVGNRITPVLDGRQVWLELEHALPTVPAWNPPAQENLRRFQLLSWTSKMGTPSFSLPAGAITMGGTCPGANAGQSVVPLSTLRRAARRVSEQIGAPVHFAQAICQHCYAEGGQYSTASVQYAQLVRLAFVSEMLTSREGQGDLTALFDYAIKNANYYLDGRRGSLDPVEGWRRARGERDCRRYFRLHDSGDFFSPGYLAIWKSVANLNPDVSFWAPSRVWVNEMLREAVNAVNGPAEHSNLVIRPSAFHINEAAPDARELGVGWAAGATTYKDSLKPDGPRVMARGGRRPPYDWDCQAYDSANELASCREARAPDGRIGCRACWTYGTRTPEGAPGGLAINYTLH
ncbi:hypothetical protein DB32_007170 [Sandaracinus amylolyticus]|uniref:Gene product 88 domain-containing protein n=1 Tax=Sandaracinus amylolyticus TaxID=927083 RepID=A0A0F6W8I0_9BACT|nr:hypothetical protein DB32_007170 [Sandaracinus amylolyticus]